MTRKLALVAMLPLLALGHCIAADGDWRILPGVGIGHVKIGMEHRDVVKVLGTPTRQDDLSGVQSIGHIPTPDAEVSRKYLPVLDGVIREDWITPLPVAKTEERDWFMCDFLTVYFKDRKVVQVEEGAARFKTRSGLSIASTGVQFEKEFPGYKETTCIFDHTSSGGWPAGKHFLDFEDAIANGIAWRYGGFGNLAPDPEPSESLEAISVHAPGMPMLIDPDGGSRFVWKDRPTRGSQDR